MWQNGAQHTPKQKGCQVPLVQSKRYHWEEGRAALAAAFHLVDEVGVLLSHAPICKNNFTLFEEHYVKFYANL